MPRALDVVVRPASALLARPIGPDPLCPRSPRPVAPAPWSSPPSWLLQSLARDARSIDLCGLFLLFLSLLTALLLPRAADGRPTPRDVLPPVVSCEYLDSRGLTLRITSGVLLREGLLLPYSALAGVSNVEVVTRDGRTLHAHQLVALHPEADLALLRLENAPEYALPSPQDRVAPIGQEVTLARGPMGSGPNTKAVLVLGTFQIGGPEYLAISEGHEDGAAAFAADGTLLGVCFDLSEQGYPLGYLVSVASIVNLVAHVGPPASIGEIEPAAPPAYKLRNEASGLTFRGALLLTAGRKEDARKFVELGTKKDGTYAPAQFWTGRIAFSEQRYEQAAVAFQKAGELSPTYHLAWHMAGASHNQAGSYDRAIEMYRRALEVAPRSALTWCNLGGAEFNRKGLTEAEAAFQRAIELDPSYGLAYFNLGILQAQLGRKDEAEAIYRTLVGKDPAWAVRLRAALDAP